MKNVATSKGLTYVNVLQDILTTRAHVRVSLDQCHELLCFTHTEEGFPHISFNVSLRKTLFVHFYYLTKKSYLELIAASN